jgi:integrase
MRLDEILKLKWRDINLPKGLIHIEKAKGSKRRDISLNSELTNLLRFCIKKPNTEYVFCDENGKPFTNINRPWRTAKRRAGIKNFRFHDLRHTYASYLVMSNVDLYVVSELLGHSSIQVTQRYAHLSPKYKKMAVEQLSKVFSQIDTSIDNLGLSSEKYNAGVAQLVEQGFCKPF